jgi:hypothetical protein
MRGGMLHYALKFTRPGGKGYRLLEGLWVLPGNRYRWYGLPGCVLLHVEKDPSRFAQAQGVPEQMVQAELETLRGVVGTRRRLSPPREEGVNEALWFSGDLLRSSVSILCQVNVLRRPGELIVSFMCPDSPTGPLFPLFLSAIVGEGCSLTSCDRCGKFFRADRGRRTTCPQCRGKDRWAGIPPEKIAAFRLWVDRTRKRGVDLRSPEGRALLREAQADLRTLSTKEFLVKYGSSRKRVRSK